MRTRQAIIATAAKRRSGRFIYLFFAQVLLLILFPYLETPGLPTALFRLLGVSAFLSCVYAVSEARPMDYRPCPRAPGWNTQHDLCPQVIGARARLDRDATKTEHRLEIRDEQVYGRVAEADD